MTLALTPAWFTRQVRGKRAKKADDEDAGGLELLSSGQRDFRHDEEWALAADFVIRMSDAGKRLVDAGNETHAEIHLSGFGGGSGSGGGK